MIAGRYHDWTTASDELDRYVTCSPALTQLASALRQRWGLLPLGCHGVRAIRGGERLSTHAWGAATDQGYSGEKRAMILAEVLPYLIAWSGEWGIQAVHDYRGSRIWRAGRTALESDACSAWWRAQKRDAGGMGQPWGNWLHIEVTPEAWADARTEVARGVT